MSDNDDKEEFSTTSGWIIKKSPTKTTHAEYAFVVKKGKQISIIERRKDHFRYFKKFDTYNINRPDNFCLSIKGVDGGGKTTSLQVALVAIGMSNEEAKEALPLILNAPFVNGK